MQSTLSDYLANEPSLSRSPSPQTRVKNVIGKGTFGTVFQYQDTKEIVKVCPLYQTKLEDTIKEHIILDNVIREATFYAYLCNDENYIVTPTSELFQAPPPSIPQGKVEFDSHHVNITMPFLGHELRTYSHTTKAKTLHLFGQLLDALAWLHARDWSHGDLKPANVLVLPVSHKVSLVDFSSILFSSSYLLCSQRCTIYYVAPEELCHRQAGPASDMWSFGCLLYEYVTNVPFVYALFEHENIPVATRELFRKYINCFDTVQGQFSSKDYLTSFYSTVMYGSILKLLYKTVKDRDLCSIIAHCLLLEPLTRITAQKLLSSASFASYESKVKPFVPSWDQSMSSFTDEESNKLVTDIENASYNVIHHGGVNEKTRKKCLRTLAQVFEGMGCKIEEDLFFHAVMMLDRLTFRKSSLINTNNSSQLLCLVMCAVFTAMIFKGYTITLEDVAKIIGAKYSIITMSNNIIYLLQKYNMRIYNLTPHFILKLTKRKPLKDTELSVLTSLAMTVPWTHSNVIQLACVFNYLRDKN